MKKKKAKPVEAETDFTVLWKMGYARESFKYVRTVCDYIIEHEVDRYSPIHHPLCVAAVVFYARPFKRSNMIGAIPLKMVPPTHHWLHAQLVTMRDQVAAHTDANAVSHGEGGPPANNVRVINEDDGTRSLGIYELKFSAEGIAQIRELAEILIGKTEYHVNRLWKKLDRKTPMMPGEYLLNLQSEIFEKVDRLPDGKIIWSD